MEFTQSSFLPKYEQKMSGFLPYTLQDRNPANFCSYFGRNNDFVNLFWNLPTFSGVNMKSFCVNLMCFIDLSTQLKSWEQLSYYHPCVTLLNIWNPFFCISWVSLIMIDLLTVRIMVENFFVLGLFRHSKLPFHTTNTYPSKSWRKNDTFIVRFDYYSTTYCTCVKQRMENYKVSKVLVFC